MSASVVTDVCVGRCGCLRRSVRMVKIKRKRRLMPPLSLFCIGCLVGAAETAAPPLVCIDGLVGAAETAAPPDGCASCLVGALVVSHRFHTLS